MKRNTGKYHLLLDKNYKMQLKFTKIFSSLRNFWMLRMAKSSVLMYVLKMFVREQIVN